MKQRHQIPSWNGQGKNAQSFTDLERQRNKQRSENETSTLTGVDSPHLWCRRLDSVRKADEKRIHSAEIWDLSSDVTSQLDRTPKRRKYPHRASMICCRSQTRLLWTHNQRRRMRAGEVFDPGKVSRKRRRGRPRHTAVGLPNITKWMSENMERITRDTRDGAGWRRLVRCAVVVRLGRLTITPDGTAK